VDDGMSVPLTSSRFVFTGRTGPYFRIWAVSLFLSVLTLGVYSAWGKVRKKRYLYAHTVIDGTGLEYRASPLAILKGRAIAVVLFGGFALTGHLVPVLRLAFVLLLLVLLPWIVVASARFNARNSAWRNIAFGFNGTIGEACKIFFGFGALAIVTLGCGYPYFKMRRARFIVGHHRFGMTQLKADLAVGGFILTYLLGFLALLSAGVLFGIAVVGAAAASRGSAQAMRLFTAVVPIFMLLLYAFYIAIYASVRASVENLTFNGIIAGPLRCRSTLRKRDMAWLYLSNVVVVLATLGLAAAWVTVRMARYRATKLCLVGNATPEVFAGAGTGTSSATGSEVSDLFDVDVSL
jgi:uncharacterized membrane protein YjgN (DUF898 family)